MLAAWLAVTAIHADFPGQADQGSLAHIAPAVSRTLRALPGPVLVQSSPDFLSAIETSGILLIAIHAGVDARLADQSTNVVGSAHTISAASARSTVVVAVDDAIDAYLDNPAYRGLAHYDPISPEDRAFHTRYDIAAHDAFFGPHADPNAWLAAHQADLARIHRLDARGSAIEVFLKTT